MQLRAVIFDLYGTLLEAGPPPANAAARWAETWRAALGTAPRLSLAQFDDACRGAVAAEHAGAQTRGIASPEVYWPDIVDQVLPEFAGLPAEMRLASPVYGYDLRHTVRLMPGAAGALRAAQEASLRMGLASNCQPYSLRELDDALAGAGLGRTHAVGGHSVSESESIEGWSPMSSSGLGASAANPARWGQRAPPPIARTQPRDDLFDPRLSFLSFEHGFSKPDPHVFRLLTTRLRTLGIAPGEALMVGDRVDHDLDPARAHGWQTFLIDAPAAAGWPRLLDRLANR